MRWRVSLLIPRRRPASRSPIAEPGFGLRSTRTSMVLQEQERNPIAGAYFVPDFAPEPTIPLQLERQARGAITIAPPPQDRNAHFWIVRRGTYPAESVDAVYVQMDLRISQPGINLVANIGADWWRDDTATFERSFANNPTAGVSDWVKLSTEWSTLRFYSPTASELMAAPPPPLVGRHSEAEPPVTRRRAIAPPPCLNRAYEPLPKPCCNSSDHDRRCCAAASAQSPMLGCRDTTPHANRRAHHSCPMFPFNSNSAALRLPDRQRPVQQRPVVRLLTSFF